MMSKINCVVGGDNDVVAICRCSRGAVDWAIVMGG